MIRIGIAGYGKMGKIREGSIYKSQECDLVSIYDPSISEISNKNIQLCSSYDELLKTEIDAVFICTYVSFSAEYVIRALDAGKHVFCEKPPSIDLKEMSEVITKEKSSKKILKYGFNHRFHYSVIDAKSIIEESTFGKPILMRGIYGKAGSIDYDKNWRNYKKFSGGGILMDQGIHMLDLFRFFSNEELLCLSSHLTTSFWDIDCEDNAFITLETNKSKIPITFHSSATQWKHKFLLEMIFEKGYVTLNGILSSTNSYAPETLLSGYREFEDITKAMGKPKETTTYYDIDDSWDMELTEFLTAIKNNSNIQNGNSKDSYEIMKLLDQIYNK